MVEISHAMILLFKHLPGEESNKPVGTQKKLVFNWNKDSMGAIDEAWGRRGEASRGWGKEDRVTKAG